MTTIITWAEAGRLVGCHRTTARRYGEQGLLDRVPVGRFTYTTLESVERYKGRSLPWALADRRAALEEET